MRRSAVPIPENLPQLARETSPEHPWPLRLLSAKIGEYISRMDYIWVEGEVTSLRRRPGAKVQYFQLADLQSQPQQTITVKMWSHTLPQAITEGMHVVLRVKPDFWEGTGSFTLHADTIRHVGLGDILARLEALKARLAAEGLFAAARKKPLPFLPRCIGLICGRNTQAEKDVVVNASQRWPGVHFSIQQVQVQGNGAVHAVIGALDLLDADPDIDVIVIARGGGSPEDLLPFSDEELIRAVAAAHTPVVSAIGHEADNPLLDYVADVRASTPTDAARRIVPDVRQERADVSAYLARARQAFARRLSMESNQLAQVRTHPALAHPENSLSARADELIHLVQWGRNYADSILADHRNFLSSHIARLRTLSPLSTLARGYSILRDENSHLVSSIEDTSKGAQLHALMYDGELTLHVESVQASANKQRGAQHNE